MSAIGIVAIGRNEGDRLRRCFTSLAPTGLPIVYVDSGSTDRSVLLARSLGIAVVELDLSRPFSAARARNEGFDLLRHDHPEIEFVMFLDGDCELAPGWLDRAKAEMDARPDAAVVCGRRREKFPEHSIYNRLVDLEWDTPIGEAIACGGDALMRADAFAKVGGYDPSAIAGEEPELCQRLRAVGHAIWRIDAEMTAHDLAMTRFGQWWRRMVRCGYNGLDIQTRLPGKDQPFGHELGRSRLWSLYWPMAVVGASLLIGVGFGPNAGVVVCFVLLALLPLRAFRIARANRHRVEDWRTALAFGWAIVLSQFANVAGQFGYLVDRARGRTGRLIEYKKGGEVFFSPMPSSTPARRRPAVFLDRDGTVIENVPYLADPSRVRPFPDAAEALGRLREAGFALVIVTNQSAVGRGRVTLDQLAAVNAEMSRQFAAEGVALDGIYFCPAVPGGTDKTAIEHPDRKPGPGMLLRAADELGLDLASSWMIGDMISDILAGVNAGCRGTVLVETGHGLADHEVDVVDGLRVAPDLTTAAEMILATIAEPSARPAHAS